MRNIFVAFILVFVGNLIFAEQNYNVYNFDNYQYTSLPVNEKILFIMDYSNSMNEFIGTARKVDEMTQTMEMVLGRVNPATELGLRVYGYRMGFTSWDSCKASRLAVEVGNDNSFAIIETLKNTKARGMTPITYSLKMAVNEDLAEVEGKKRIILLSDGGENCDESPCAYATRELAKRRDIMIDVIAFNIDNDEDLNQLKCVALVTSGKFYTANTKGELVKVLDKSVEAKKEVEAEIMY